MLTYISLTENASIVKENTNRTNKINSLLLINPKENNSILIDSNFPTKFIDQFYQNLKNPVSFLLLSHCHLDHSSRAYYHQKKYHTNLFCPIQEKEYVVSLDSLLTKVGIKKLGLTKSFKIFANEYIKYRKIDEIKTYRPGEDSFIYPTIKIKTIHIPGHSPGHTAFDIILKNSNFQTKILYVSDIGSYPYYGDLNSNLSDYRTSIDKLENLYLNDDYMLIPAHGNFYLEKEPDFFQRIRNKINKNEKKILEALHKFKPKSIKELVEESILTPKNRIFQPLKNLYYLWDGGKIYHHLNELVDNGVVERVEHKDILNDKYILI